MKTVFTKRLGETNISTNNELMTIINYRNVRDIDVKFEDNTIVTHKTYNAFKNGHILNPNYYKKQYIHTFNMANCGVKMSVIDYCTSDDINIEFETGYKKEHTTMTLFNLGKISHPFPYIIKNITIEKLAYVYNDIGNFYCKCNKCGYKDVLTIEEAKKHKCCIKGWGNLNG
ncbi:MAG: hypothetical protein VZS44_10845 [Bacilli bacterium]|nr:hypothetical protein [Bacilli bacterium]